MAHYSRGRRGRQIEMIRRQFAQADGLAFADVLPAQRLEQAFFEERAQWSQRVYTPLLTLWAFLGQIVSTDGSCRAAVARVLAWLVSRGQPPCSPNTDPYCKARKRLPESLFTRLVRETGASLHDETPLEWRWKGRHVKIADGTTVSMPDTAENQIAYPQPSSQQPGLGFPLARLVTIFCLACGSVLDAAIGPYQGKKRGENTLLRTMERALVSGDVLLADRYFCGYFDIAFWQQRGVDVVVRLHQRRTCDLRRGRRLSANDHVVRWHKPRRPSWMDEETYATMPDTLSLREVRLTIDCPGFRSESIVVVTTLLDAEVYANEDITDLYRARWHAELDLRSLKITLGMDVLRCKSPDMVRKEIWAHLLVYNLIRTVMAQAAEDQGSKPRDLSFAGALQTLAAFADRLVDARPDRFDELYDGLLLAIGAHHVGDRPNRVEPRAKKRRPKPYPLLTQPRQTVRNHLMAIG